MSKLHLKAQNGDIPKFAFAESYFEIPIQLVDDSDSLVDEKVVVQPSCFFDSSSTNDNNNSNNTPRGFCTFETCVIERGVGKARVYFNDLALHSTSNNGEHKKVIVHFTVDSKRYKNLNIANDQTMPISIIRYKLLIEEDNNIPYIWYKDEGGKDKCIELKVSLVDKNNERVRIRKVPLKITLVYAPKLINVNGNEVLINNVVNDQNILSLNQESHLIIDENSALIKIRINEVSTRHQGQLFQVMVSPDIVHSPSLCDISSEVYSTPIDVKSKRNHHKDRQNNNAAAASQSQSNNQSLADVMAYRNSTNNSNAGMNYNNNGGIGEDNPVPKRSKQEAKLAMATAVSSMFMNTLPINNLPKLDGIAGNINMGNNNTGNINIGNNNMGNINMGNNNAMGGNMDLGGIHLLAGATGLTGLSGGSGSSRNSGMGVCGNGNLSGRSSNNTLNTMNNNNNNMNGINNLTTLNSINTLNTLNPNNNMNMNNGGINNNSTLALNNFKALRSSLSPQNSMGINDGNINNNNNMIMNRESMNRESMGSATSGGSGSESSGVYVTYNDPITLQTAIENVALWVKTVMVGLEDIQWRQVGFAERSDGSPDLNQPLYTIANPINTINSISEQYAGYVDVSLRLLTAKINEHDFDDTNIPTHPFEPIYRRSTSSNSYPDISNVNINGNNDNSSNNGSSSSNNLNSNNMHSGGNSHNSNNNMANNNSNSNNNIHNLGSYDASILGSADNYCSGNNSNNSSMLPLGNMPPVRSSGTSGKSRNSTTSTNSYNERVERIDISRQPSLTRQRSFFSQAIQSIAPPVLERGNSLSLWNNASMFTNADGNNSTNSSSGGGNDANNIFSLTKSLSMSTDAGNNNNKGEEFVYYIIAKSYTPSLNAASTTSLINTRLSRSISSSSNHSSLKNSKTSNGGGGTTESKMSLDDGENNNSENGGNSENNDDVESASKKNSSIAATKMDTGNNNNNNNSGSAVMIEYGLPSFDSTKTLLGFYRQGEDFGVTIPVFYPFTTVTSSSTTSGNNGNTNQAQQYQSQTQYCSEKDIILLSTLLDDYLAKNDPSVFSLLKYSNLSDMVNQAMIYEMCNSFEGSLEN